jgi:glycerol-3-phosphate acyltransferase PlsX
MRIVLDAMGSDGAPSVDVEGAVRGARRFGCQVVLVGRRDEVEAELARHDTAGLSLSVVHAPDVIGMDEHPAQAARAKPHSSMVVGMGLVRAGEADAFVSAGNSGGVLAAAIASEGRLGRIDGVLRPAISTVFPTLHGIAFLLDIGANTDSRAEWLVQFAQMGEVYARCVLGVAHPRVALLSNGEEESKGPQAVQDAHRMLREMMPNFVGNVEGKDLTAGAADVIACDGFAGNVAIKTAEGVASMLMASMRREITARPLTKIGGLLAKPAFRQVARKLDFREYGGGPLLGVNGVVIIAHGRSDGLAMENAVRVAVESVQNDVVGTIRRAMADGTSGADEVSADEASGDKVAEGEAKAGNTSA